MNLARFGAALLLLPALAGAADSPNPRRPLPIAEVVDLSKSAAQAEEVIQRIHESATTYALRGSDFARLKAAGVSDAVLDYLQQSFVDDVDLLTRYWVLGGDLGGCSFCYPQPVDLAAMRSGYAELGEPPPSRYDMSKPAGTPAWVPFPPSGLTSARLSVSEIVQLAAGGMPPDELVRRIRSARLDHVTAGGAATAIRSHPLAVLTGAELARLEEQGVPEAALDALQGQFLAAFIEAQRLRYQNWGKGSKI